MTCKSRSLVLLAFPFLLFLTAGDAAAQPKDGKVLVRPKYEDGRTLKYSLKLRGEGGWMPRSDDFKWWKMQTSFLFTLKTKRLRKGGLCTFELAGHELESSGEGTDGEFEVSMDRKKAEIELNDRVELEPETPLTRPMTLTLGPLGGARFSTGTAPIAIYALPHVDRRFWDLLSLAPLDEVAPGDSWKQDMEVKIPDSDGEPLRIQAKWEVGEWKQYEGSRVLPMRLVVELDPKNTAVVLKNGDRAVVSTGTYAAIGEVMWDVENGILCLADARQEFLVEFSEPKKRRYESRSSSSLRLLAYSDSPRAE